MIFSAYIEGIVTLSITLVLNKLNDDGLMEAMRRILDVANDPKYCKIKETT